MQTTRGQAQTTHGRICFLHGGDGPGLLFLHGVPGSARVWEPMIARLDAGSVIAPDLLGFGDSDSGPDLHAEAQAAAMIELLDVIGMERATVITHDFGGPVALRMFEQRPELVDGLLLSATNAFGDTPIPFPLSTIFWPVVGPIAAHALFSPTSLRMMLRTGVGSPRPCLDAAVYVGDRRQASTIRTIFETSLRQLRALYGPLEQLLKSIDIPTEVVWGDRDPFFAIESGQRTADAIAGARLTTLDGAGHFLPAERPAEMLAAVDQLMVRRAAAPAVEPLTPRSSGSAFSVQAVMRERVRASGAGGQVATSRTARGALAEGTGVPERTPEADGQRVPEVPF